MKTARFALLPLAGLAALLVSCGPREAEEPPAAEDDLERAEAPVPADLDDAPLDTPEVPAAPDTAPAGEEGALVFAGLAAPLPEGWTVVPPENAMRLVQAEVPFRADASDDAEADAPAPGETPPPAEFIVYYFGPKQGGTFEQNVNRWASQFTDDTGAPVMPTVEEIAVAGYPAHRVEFAGTYDAGAMMGGGGPRPDRVMIMTMIEAPDGAVFLRLLGPRETVLQHERAYDELVRSIRPR